MSLNTNNIPVYGALGPLGPKDTYPTHEAIYGKGGLMQVRTLEERDAIPEERREIGLQVLVMDNEDISSQNPDYGVYVLDGGINNANWSRVRHSKYSGSYSTAVIFSITTPTARENNSPLTHGDLWVQGSTLYIYFEPERRWVLISAGSNTGGGGGGGGGGGVTPTPEKVFLIPFPTNTAPVLVSDWSYGEMTLTPLGCIQLSTDNVTYSQDPVSIEDEDDIWVRWNPSEACGGATHGTTIHGTITNGSYTIDGSLTIDKLVHNFNFSDLIDQNINSVSTSDLEELTGHNSDLKVWAPSGTASTKQISINGGSWTGIPSSYGSALTIPYTQSGSNIKIRHTNLATTSTNCTTELRVGYGSMTGEYISTVWTTVTTATGPTIAQPTILTPVNNATNVSTPTTITSSAYAALNGAGSHAHSDWQVHSGDMTLTSSQSITSTSFSRTASDYSAVNWYYLGHKNEVIPVLSRKNVTFTALGNVPQGQNKQYFKYREPYDEPLHNSGYEYWDYSPKLAILVTAGASGTVGRIAYRRSYNWNNLNIFNSWMLTNYTDCNIVGTTVGAGVFKDVLWVDRLNIFIAFRSVQFQPEQEIVYTSNDGITFTERNIISATGSTPAVEGGIYIRKGRFISLDGINYIAASGDNNAVVHKVRDRYVRLIDGVLSSSVDGISWTNRYSYPFRTVNYSSFLGRETQKQYLDEDGNLTSVYVPPQVRSHYDLFFQGDRYTLDGENYFPLETKIGSNIYRDFVFMFSDFNYYYLIRYDEHKYQRYWRAPRNYLVLNIVGANQDGFKVGNRVRLSGVPNTYGWIHAITSNSVTIRGAYGDWSNPVGRTIAIETASTGSGLIVDLVDNVANKTSYTVAAELMDPLTNHYARVRYGDGSIKSSWSPWSKFTTGE